MADWYSLAFYTSHIKAKIIEQDSSTSDAVLVALLAVAGIATLLGIVELVAFMLQFRDARFYVTPRVRSELMEEVTSCSLLLSENLALPLTLLIGYLLGSCALAAYVRSFPARMALVASGVSVVWRIVQSFAYCCHCSSDSVLLTCWMWLRYIRGFIMASAIAIIVFLLSLSLSLATAVKIDDYLGNVKDAAQHRDVADGVFLYQRFAAPYTITSSGTQDECNFFETRARIAHTDDIETIHRRARRVKMPCTYFSEFYETLLLNKHRSLAATYHCDVIVGLYDDDFRAARIINAGYQLADPESPTCVSGTIDLEFDHSYSISDSIQMNVEFVYSNRSVFGLVHTLCGGGACAEDVPPRTGNVMNFDCDSLPSCVNYINSSRDEVLGHVSTLLVGERELMSLYPCMPQIVIDASLDLSLCEGEVEEPANATRLEYTTCRRPFLVHVDGALRREWEQEEGD